MRFHLKFWVAGEFEGTTGHKESLDFKAKNLEEAKETARSEYGKMLQKHKCTDRHVRSILFQEMERL